MDTLVGLNTRFLFNWHFSDTRKYLGLQTFMSWVKILDQYKCHADVGGHRLQKVFERFKTTC